MRPGRSGRRIGHRSWVAGWCCDVGRVAHMPATRRRRRRARRTREGALAGWPEVRVKPGALCQRGPRASTRPRRPVDAKTILKNGECFSPPAKASLRQGGQGLVSPAVAPRRWASVPCIRKCRTRPSHRCRGLKLTERPRKSRRSGRFQMAARRRNKPLPTLPQAKPRSARSEPCRPAQSKPCRPAQSEPCRHIGNGVKFAAARPWPPRCASPTPPTRRS